MGAEGRMNEGFYQQRLEKNFYKSKPKDVEEGLVVGIEPKPKEENKGVLL